MKLQFGKIDRYPHPISLSLGILRQPIGVNFKDQLGREPQGLFCENHFESEPGAGRARVSFFRADASSISRPVVLASPLLFKCRANLGNLKYE